MCSKNHYDTSSNDSHPTNCCSPSHITHDGDEGSDITGDGEAVTAITCNGDKVEEEKEDKESKVNEDETEAGEEKEAERHYWQ
jgi:hypothetical protein